ncbi:MAG: LPXTG cell wall anchor domain-containing protein [Terriglobales bacterium]
MNSRTAQTKWSLVLAVGVLCLASTFSMTAQVQTSTSTTAHKASVVTKVEKGEIVYVSGNNVVVKMEDGSLRYFDNVPDSAKITVDGKELGVHDLQVGMKVERTITTRTTPKTITTVKSVTGKVWHVNPPSSVILTMEDGTNQQFTIPKNQKFNVDGQMVDAWGLKKGMKISATKVVEEPVTVVQQEMKATGTMPPPPPADVPILIVAVPTPPAAVAEAVPAELPKTGSPLPLIGFLGLLSLASAFGLKVVRTKLGN